MPFYSNRHFWVFVLFCATAGGFFVLSRHSANAPNSTSPNILITPVVMETLVPTSAPTVMPSAPVSAASSGAVSSAPLTPTVTGSAYREATDADVIDLKKIRSKDAAVSVHSVESGENYWILAKQANIDLYTLIGANPTMPFKAALNKPLNILSRKGVLHTVLPDETLSKLAEEYQTSEKIIRDANGIHWWHPMKTGDVLFIPNVRPLLMVKEWKDYFSKRGMFNVPFSKGASWTRGFGLKVDPFTGEKREHTGIDLRAKYGDPVYASKKGKVIFTGVAGGYGNLIKIAHEHGYVTYYGHLSKIYAKVGQKVRQGTLIGRVGATGRVTGPHLHFEIRLNGKPVDPLPLI